MNKKLISTEWLNKKIKEGATSRDCARSSGYSKTYILNYAKNNGLKFNNKNPLKNVNF